MPAELGHHPEFNLRGVFTTGGDCSYRFRTVKPRLQPIPGEIPVGSPTGLAVGLPTIALSSRLATMTR